MLSVQGLRVRYGEFEALSEVSIRVARGQVVSILGANGAGKSTLLKTITGLVKCTAGSIRFEEEPIDGLEPHQIVERGLGLVPEGRKIFHSLTVLENLWMGAYTRRARRSRRDSVERVFGLFPRLQERVGHRGADLSGGEQQMLAIGRALMSRPRLLILDEVSLGLSPLVVKNLYEAVAEINREGMTVVLVEQDVRRSLKAADYAYILQEGEVTLEGDPEALTEDQVRRAYFGL